MNKIIKIGNKSTYNHKIISVSQKGRIYTIKTIEKVGIHKTAIIE